jgi:hypothetical protein
MSEKWDELYANEDWLAAKTSATALDPEAGLDDALDAAGPDGDVAMQH